MKRILVPFDFSKTAQEAFKFALQLAKANQGKILVLYVIDLPFTYDTLMGMPYLDSASLFRSLSQHAITKFERMKMKSAKGHSAITFETAQGKVTQMIRQCIDKYKPSVVVMGTHSEPDQRGFLFGSTTEKIIRFSSAPVLAVRKSVPLSSIKNIAFPTDGQLNQAAMIRQVKSLQLLFRAKLHLLFVSIPSSPMGTARLERYAQHYKLTNCTLNERQNEFAADGILQFVQEIKPDLLVMSTHGRKGAAHLFYGSVTEQVVNRISCPMWTYHSK
jgi:nucleotide-binding universal stress UspA family protein